MSPVRRRRVYKWELDTSRDRKPALRGLWRRISPQWLFIGSFLVVIAVGAGGLMGVPAFFAEGEEALGPVDALFTSTSAVCVTGLIVVDTESRFTAWGKLWLLGLIQLGGLGIISYTTVLIAALGGRPSLRQERIVAGARDAVPTLDYRRLARDVIVFTAVLELLGAAILWLLWWPELGWWSALGHGSFHAISAFCNAGFSTYTSSMMDQPPAVLSVVMLLIACGGVGFLTIEELWLRFRALVARRRYRISLHSRIVLGMTALLIVGGWLAFMALEWGNVLSGRTRVERAFDALFMSVTARTAGFNSVQYVGAGIGANFLTILLMFIGGASGSTAGGLKVTTVALPGLLAWSRLRGREVTGIWRRTVPAETINRAVGLVVLGFAMVTGSILLLAIVEGGGDERFLAYMFEAVSAFATVGLSLDVTPGLSPFGKLLIVLLMFLGRVGLPTVAAALTVTALRPPGELRYASEDVVVG